MERKANETSCLSDSVHHILLGVRGITDGPSQHGVDRSDREAGRETSKLAPLGSLPADRTGLDMSIHPFQEIFDGFGLSGVDERHPRPAVRLG